MTDPISVPVQVPLIGLQMSTETAQYVGMLEGTVAALVINDVKYRTLLELLTGESWEDTVVTMDPNALMSLAVSALVKQTGMDYAKAKILISQRWQRRNPPAGSIVPQAVPVETLISGAVEQGTVSTETIAAESKSTTTAAEPEKLSITDRYRLWKESQLEAAAEIEVPTADDATTEATAN